MSAAAENEGVECLSCNAQISGIDCSICGEKRIGPQDLQLSHLALDVWHESTHLAGRIWRSFLTLLGALQ
jgi:hypothetical protein